MNKFLIYLIRFISSMAAYFICSRQWSDIDWRAFIGVVVSGIGFTVAAVLQMKEELK